MIREIAGTSSLPRPVATKLIDKLSTRHDGHGQGSAFVQLINVNGRSEVYVKETNHRPRSTSPTQTRSAHHAGVCDGHVASADLFVTVPLRFSGRVPDCNPSLFRSRTFPFFPTIRWSGRTCVQRRVNRGLTCLPQRDHMGNDTGALRVLVKTRS